MVVFRLNGANWIPITLFAFTLIYGLILLRSYPETPVHSGEHVRKPVPVAGWVGTHTVAEAVLHTPVPAAASATEYATAENGGNWGNGEHTSKNPIYNSTLGFGEIFFISMPERTDRQDAMTLLASFSGLTLTYVPGVNGSTISPKARPHKAKVTLAELGAWRAHANVWQRIIHDNLESALILEDDLDWDVNMAKSLEIIAQHIPNSASSPPYGYKEWDTFWIGACLHDRNKAEGSFETRFSDPYAPKNLTNMKKYDYKYFEKQVLTGGPYDTNGERVLQASHHPICTMGYAVTRRGAQRLLYNVGYRGLDGPVDLAIAHNMKQGKINGYVVWPPLITAWRIGGMMDSDIQKAKGEGRGNDGGWSKSLQRSARKEMARQWGGSAN